MRDPGQGAAGLPPSVGLPENRLTIREGGLADPRVLELLRAHWLVALAQAPSENAGLLGLDALQAPEVRFWTIWDGPALAGCGALRRLSANHGELKSMHTLRSMRGRGIGSALLGHILVAAQAAGIARISLETGSSSYFRPARSLYEAHGFVECPPFGPYRTDPNSAFMSLELPPLA